MSCFVSPTRSIVMGVGADMLEEGVGCRLLYRRMIPTIGDIDEEDIFWRKNEKGRAWCLGVCCNNCRRSVVVVVVV